MEFSAWNASVRSYPKYSLKGDRKAARGSGFLRKMGGSLCCPNLRTSDLPSLPHSQTVFITKLLALPLRDFTLLLHLLLTFLLNATRHFSLLGKTILSVLVIVSVLLWTRVLSFQDSVSYFGQAH